MSSSRERERRGIGLQLLVLALARRATTPDRRRRRPTTTQVAIETLYYLCEQAAEKVIRAVLTSEGKHAGIKHRLDEMVDLVPDGNPLKPALRDIEELAAYATAYRYPTSSGRIPDAPSVSEINSLIQKVEAALGEAASRFRVDLQKKGAPAGKPGPFRNDKAVLAELDRSSDRWTADIADDE